MNIKVVSGEVVFATKKFNVNINSIDAKNYDEYVAKIFNKYPIVAGEIIIFDSKQESDVEDILKQYDAEFNKEDIIFTDLQRDRVKGIKVMTRSEAINLINGMTTFSLEDRVLFLETMIENLIY